MHLIVFLVLLPMATAFLLGILFFFQKKANTVIIIGSSLLHSLLIYRIISKALNQALVYQVGSWGNLGINLVVDHYSILMLALTGVLFPLVVLYSLNWVEVNRHKYFILLFLSLAGINGMVITADLFNLYVFLEITSITSYVLVALPQKPENIEGAFKYMVLGSIGGLFILIAIILTYYTTGQLGLHLIAQEFSTIPALLKNTIIAFFLFGFSFKFAMFPLHAWLPDAYSNAPVPYNALSSGLLIKTFLLVMFRILYLFPGQEFLMVQAGEIIMYWGVLTFIFAHILAFQQKNILRLLGYSTIAQIGYIIVGMSLATESGIIGGSFHLINHAIIKGTLFFAAGIFITRTDYNIDDFKGLGYSLPLTSLAFLTGALAMIGIPPLNGFVSKWLILKASIESGFTFTAIFILLGSFMALVYYLNIIRTLYSSTRSEIGSQESEVNWKYRIPVYFLSLLCILTGILPDYVLKFVNKIPEVLLEKANYIDLLMGG